jgi:DNA-directed RNA polymerase subunit N (RpoN/RPB10)
LYFDLVFAWTGPEKTCSVITEFLSPLLFIQKNENLMDDLPVERYPCDSAPP